MKDKRHIKIQDIQNDNSKDFYSAFREKLKSVEQFPTVYTFKFIIPASEVSKREIEKIFQHPSTKIQSKDSKTGKYNALTVETFVNDADDVIAYYQKASSIEKIILL
ncbi:DUF493 domain-containing protein [Sphingobacterium sp. SGG-5]|uniref:DUF493 family protein n=1 Tax=Sphingobacterium sp. SGG-5 TaxID=2710881 RepID=UPI0013EBD269|nr:DUF493 family protein [Sphingobacterium sp. SGG-5]NGM60586.1 DUF493 domain-containing protein [Sphingobacterium sp. SGG-5]